MGQVYNELSQSLAGRIAPRLSVLLLLIMEAGLALRQPQYWERHNGWLSITPTRAECELCAPEDLPLVFILALQQS